MAGTTEVRRGMIILYNNEPHIIIEKEFYSPGKGGAFNRVKLKSIRSGKILSQTFKSGEKLEELEISTSTMQFLYVDGDIAYFMNPESFDQVGINLDLIPGSTDFLHTEAKYIVTSYDGEPIYVQMPPKISLVITETPDAVKGDSVSNATKEAILETGVKINVPLFIKTGEKIVVNTEDYTYFSKA